MARPKAPPPRRGPHPPDCRCAVHGDRPEPLGAQFRFTCTPLQQATLLQAAADIGTTAADLIRLWIDGLAEDRTGWVEERHLARLADPARPKPRKRRTKR